MMKKKKNINIIIFIILIILIFIFSLSLYLYLGDKLDKTNNLILFYFLISIGILLFIIELIIIAISKFKILKILKSNQEINDDISHSYVP